MARAGARVRPLGGSARGVHADAAAHLETVPDQPLQPLVPRAREVAEQVEPGRAPDVEHPGAATVHDLDETSLLQPFHGLADRVPVHCERHRELALGRQLVARLRSRR